MYNKSPMYIKQEINPLDFLQHELSNVTLNKQGWNEGGLCPFHADTKPGSFHVNSESGAFKCFSCGTKGGDIIDFTMVLYDLTFPEALVKLAEDWVL